MGSRDPTQSKIRSGGGSNGKPSEKQAQREVDIALKKSGFKEKAK
jgi:hypothetical protein